MSTLSPKSDSHHYRRASRVARYAAPRLGMQPGAVEQLVKGHQAVHVRVAVLFEAALALGDYAFAATIAAPLDAVRAGATWTETPEQLLQQDTLADAGEDVARIAYLLNKTTENRNELLRRYRERAGVLSRVLSALEREQREARS